MRVLLQDAIVLGYCRRGCRALCERYGLDYNDIVFNGIEADELAKIDDAMVHDLIAEAHRRTTGVQNGQ